MRVHFDREKNRSKSVRISKFFSGGFFRILGFVRFRALVALPPPFFTRLTPVLTKLCASRREVHNGAFFPSQFRPVHGGLCVRYGLGLVWRSNPLSYFSRFFSVAVSRRKPTILFLTFFNSCFENILNVERKEWALGIRMGKDGIDFSP